MESNLEKAAEVGSTNDESTDFLHGEGVGLAGSRAGSGSARPAPTTEATGPPAGDARPQTTPDSEPRPGEPGGGVIPQHNVQSVENVTPGLSSKEATHERPIPGLLDKFARSDRSGEPPEPAEAGREPVPGGVMFELIEQFTDLRSNEIAYIFKVTDNSPQAILLTSITPRIPENVEIVEVKDPSSVALKIKHTDLCKDLSELIQNYLITRVEVVNNVFLQRLKEIILDIFKDYFKITFGFIGLGFLKIFSYILNGVFLEKIKILIRRSRAYTIKIESRADAQRAYERWITGATGDLSLIKEVFETKMGQLLEIEEAMKTDAKSSAIATIEPSSFFAMTYVLRFPRRAMNPRKYTIAIEGGYSYVRKPSGQTERHVGAATSSLIISPQPWFLTTVAVVSSFLGVVLKNAQLDAGVNASQKSPPPSADQGLSLIEVLTRSLHSAQILTAAILALVFFNIYEYTDFGKKLRMGIGWRSAMLIGVLCGLIGERFLAAIKTLVGT